MKERAFQCHRPCLKRMSESIEKWILSFNLFSLFMFFSFDLFPLLLSYAIASGRSPLIPIVGQPTTRLYFSLIFSFLFLSNFFLSLNYQNTLGVLRERENLTPRPIMAIIIEVAHCVVEFGVMG